MKKILTVLGMAAMLLSCTKEITIDHHISAEFPRVGELSGVRVLFAAGGDADILVTPDGGRRVITYKALSIVTGDYTDAELSTLLEETFWRDPSRQWIIHTASPVEGTVLGGAGFVNCLRARGLSAEGGMLFASSNTYDKIEGITVSPLGFTVKVKEAAL